MSESLRLLLKPNLKQHKTIMGQKGRFHSIGGYEVKFGFYNAVIVVKKDFCKFPGISDRKFSF